MLNSADQYTNTGNSQSQPNDPLALPAKQETPTQQFPTNDPEFQAFSTQFQKYVGQPLPDVVNSINDIRQWKAQQTVKEQEQQVRGLWGNIDDTELNQRLGMVRERFNQLPPEVRHLYDNPNGADLIYQRLMQETQMDVPSIDRPTTNQAGRTGGTSRYQFVESEVQALPNAEYNKIVNEYTSAVAQGRVLLDVSGKQK
jgi:hypothetical protein